MVMVALPIMAKLDPTSVPIMQEMARKMPKTNAGNQADAITPVRMAAAFPDIAIVGACLNNKSQILDFYSVWEDRYLKFPSALMFAQAYQLNLDPLLKKAASHFNVHYWMNTVRSKLEVATGPKFNFTYMKTGLEDDYEPFFLKSKMDKSLIKELEGVMNLEKLMKYHISVLLAFSGVEKVSTIRVVEAFDILSQTQDYMDMSNDLMSLSEVDMDMFSDKSKRLMSNSDEFITQRNQRLLETVAPSTTIIQNIPAASDNSVLIKAMEAIAAGVRQQPVLSMNNALEIRKSQLRMKHPAFDEPTIEALAKEEIVNEQNKSLMRRFLGW
jgi:hypothetical protein